MKQDIFFDKFIKSFEPQFEETVNQLYLQSNNNGIDTEIIKTFFEPLLPFIRSGKRIRPFLISVGADEVNDKVIHAGVAFELCHTFALVHDDIMDGAKLRRDVPTIHEAFNNKGLKGEVGAILIGDFLLSAANEYMAQHVPELLPLFSKMQRFLCIGQFYEMFYWEKNIDKQISKNISRFKSAQYTFMYPIQFGLHLAGKDIHMLDTYCDATGLAFQLRDDWMDISEEMNSGKDKNLDMQNNVPNTAQLLLAENENDKLATKKAVQGLLEEYSSTGNKSLQELELSAKQRQSLLSLLSFSTTIG